MTSKEHEADQTGVEAGFWTREEYCRFRNIPPSQERRERAAGNGPRFLIADRNGRVLYPVAEVKEYVRRLPTFGSRAEVYAAFPSLVERDAQQSENLEQQRKRRWTAETRARAMWASPTATRPRRRPHNPNKESSGIGRGSRPHEHRGQKNGARRGEATGPGRVTSKC